METSSNEKTGTLSKGALVRDMGFWRTAFPALLVLTGLDAYAVGPVPLSWLVSSALILMWAIYLLRGSNLLEPWLLIFTMLFCWLLGVSLFSTAFGRVDDLMPARATTPYWGYIALRFFNLLVFLATVMLTKKMIESGYEEVLRRWLVVGGLLIAALALYVYIAQIYELPEPPRTRIGTGGEEQSILFDYGFHRAMGTFREPSHLAQWLVTPLVLSMATRGKLGTWSGLTILTVMLLTGSLTGILAVGIGFCMTSLLLMARDVSGQHTWKALGRLLIKLLIFVVTAYLGFQILVRGYGSETTGLIEQLWTRIQPILLEEGVLSTNRDYVYEYFSGTPITIVGQGLGNANILFASALGIDVLPSFLSLYLNLLFSGGMIALLLAVALLVAPIISVMARHTGYDFHAVAALMGYCAWLVVFASHAEELHIMFAVPFGYLIARHFAAKRTPTRVAVSR